MVSEKYCSFVCLKRREEAMRAYKQLKTNKRLAKRFGGQIKVCLKCLYIHLRFSLIICIYYFVCLQLGWAAAKGLKTLEHYREYWQFDEGCAFVPYSVLNLCRTRADLNLILDGSIMDNDSWIPEHLKGLMRL